MLTKMNCTPPLGSFTAIPAGQDVVKFAVVLETSGDVAAGKHWQVALWHDMDSADGQWSAVDFEEKTINYQVLSVQALSSGISRKVFTLSLPGRPKDKTQVRFTIKFRTNTEAEWKWANEQYSHGDGVLLYQPAFERHDLSYFISGTQSTINLEALTADTPDTQLWSMKAPVGAAKGDESGYSTHRLGLPNHVHRWFSLVRLWTPWLAPRHGKHAFSPDKDAVLAAFLRDDGLHIVMLAISGLDDVLTLLKADSEGNVLIHARNDAEAASTSHVLVAVAESFEVANAAVMYQARHMVMSLAPSARESELTAMLDKEVKPQWLEEWADGFAYCTWNSLGQNLTEEKIINALESFKSAGIDIQNLIVDDLWQSVDHPGAEQYVRGMTQFQANIEGFPNGLYHTVSEIRSRFGIQNVAVWHAILGYWGGIGVGSQLAKNYKTVKVNGPDWLCIDPDDAARWYDNFYEFLSVCGIDSVKTDAQMMLDDLHSAVDRRRMIKEFQDIWSIQMLRSFSGRAISCMSQTPQMLFHSQLPTNKPRVIVRNSDDFFPDVEDSHPWHLFCNAHNALFTQHLNVLPDWDMMQSLHPWAGPHAAARCLSGGPIYITDTPGKHNPELVHQMMAKTPRGTSVILRPPRLGKTSQAYIGYDELKMLRIETYSGAARTGSSMLGLFNTTKSRLSELVTLNDMPGTEEGEYVIRSHVEKKISKPTSRAANDVLLSVDLDVRGYDVLSATPIRRFNMKGGEVAVASLGLLGKLSGAAGIVGIDIFTEKNGKLSVYSSYKALGVIGFYISDLETRSVENDFMALMFGSGIPLECVRKSMDFENVLEVDLEKAWALSDQKHSWSNEAHVELFILR